MHQAGGDYRERHAIREEMGCVCVAQGVRAGALWQPQPAEEQGDRRRDRIGLQRCPVRVGEDQVAVGLVIWPELVMKFILLLPVHFNRSADSGILTTRGLSVFVPLNSRTCLVCVSDRAMVARPSWKSDQRNASTSPRRAAKAAATSRNAARHQGPPAASNASACCAAVVFFTRGGSLFV